MIKTALTHDWLVGIGGGERVLEAIYELYPSPIYTLVHDAKKLKGTFFEDKEIHTSFIQRLPKGKTAYRYYLPLYPLAIEQFDLSKYDLVISSSHAAAKGALTHTEQLHLCYCNTPMRYAWDLYHAHMAAIGPLQRLIAKPTLHYLRQWDLISSYRVDQFAANSKYVAKRIKKVYGRESRVIYPPVSTHQFSINKKESFYLAASRLVPYKRIDLIVEAFSHIPDKKLVVIGDGPEMNKIKAKATKNVEILGYQPDHVMRDYLSRAKAFIYAALEEFGIIVVEAQAAGTPVIALGRGGALETVIENQTGLFFPEEEVGALISAVNTFEKNQDRFDPKKIKSHAETFNEERFEREFKQFIDEGLEKFYEGHYSGRRERDAALAHF